MRFALSSGNNPRLTCESYFAITANTVQFGARAQLYAAAYGFSVEGDIGYDVLLQIAPLHFVADFHAKVALKRGLDSTLYRPVLRGAALLVAASRLEAAEYVSAGADESRIVVRPNRFPAPRLP